MPSPLNAIRVHSFLVGSLSLTVFTRWGSLTPPLTRTRPSLPHLSLPSHLTSNINVLVFEKTYGQISIFITKAKKPALPLVPNKKSRLNN